ncbi:MAG: tetratricopeptide repeat protein [Methylococcaceae bacterium]|nr:tetratricopeptide repeat protein [Methylococcaceae bacterium]
MTATEEVPEDWLDQLPLPSHLLCYESFNDSKVIMKQFIQQLKADGITAKVDKAFSALPHEVIRAFNEIRDEAVINNQVVKDIDDDEEDDEGERLYDLACEYEDGSNKVIPDLKKAFKLFMQSAELGYESAYFSLALAYFNGDGVKKDLNESLNWAMRSIESGCIYGYYVAADCFVEAGMKEQASDMWRRCFKELIHEDLPNVLGVYARHVSEGLVEQVHTKKIARLFGIVAKKESVRKAYIWLWENQVTDSNFDDINDQDVECLRNAAEQGDAEAQFELGQMYKLGSGLEQDDEQALYWFSKAAEQGLPNAQYSLAEMYLNGCSGGLEPDDEQAVIWFRKAAEQGHANAQFSLGEMYDTGDFLEEDEEQATIWYRKAGEQGHVDAQYSLGEMYFWGKGLEQDFKQAAIWHRKAAEQGEREAQYKLGYMFYHYEELEQYFEQAAYWLRKAAEQGDHSAQYLLAKMYDEGHGVAQDDDQAITWYRKAAESSNTLYLVRGAAEQGSVNAQYTLHEFAEEGNEYAQCALAFMYYNGNGLEQDYEQAAIWYHKAAENGSEDAQLILGQMYYIGESVEQDDEQAIFWYRKASEQGNTDAEEALIELGVDWEST